MTNLLAGNEDFIVSHTNKRKIQEWSNNRYFK